MMQKQHSYLQTFSRYQSGITLAAISLANLLTDCANTGSLISQVSAQNEPSPTPMDTLTPSPTATLTPVPATVTPTLTPTPTPTATATPWPSPTPLATSTPWPVPVAWQPSLALPTLPATLPTLTPVPRVETGAIVQGGLVPINYAPPNDVDIFGNIILRWEYAGTLAEDEFFDIKIKPLGSQNSAFVDWSRTKEYELRSWSGWTPGIYTWQIGIVKGYFEGETKHLIADTGRDSTPFTIKWQAAGGGGDNSKSGNGGGSGGRSGGS